MTDKLNKKIRLPKKTEKLTQFIEERERKARIEELKKAWKTAQQVTDDLCYWGMKEYYKERLAELKDKE